MCAASDLRADQGVFSSEVGGVDFFQPVPPDVVIPIAGGSLQVCFSDMALLHGADDTQLIVFRCLVDLIKTGTKFL